MSQGGRLAAVAAAGLLPWVVVLSGGSVGLVFSFGLVNPTTGQLTTLPTYLMVLTSGLPQSLLAWPIATLLWLAAVGSSLVGLWADREDRRVTGGLLVLAGVSLLPAAVTVGRPSGVTALPVGTASLWVVGWWGYRDALSRIVTGETARER